jgi:hypothetical protein
MNKHDRMAEAEIAAYAKYQARLDRKRILEMKRFAKEQARIDREWFKKTLRQRLDASTSIERLFWIEFYNQTVAAYATTFGEKYTPETFDEADRMAVGEQDWNALVKAIRHVQSFLVQHDADHEAAGL